MSNMHDAAETTSPGPLRSRHDALNEKSRKGEGRGTLQGTARAPGANERLARMLAFGQSFSAIQKATGCSRATIAKVAKRKEQAA